MSKLADYKEFKKYQPEYKEWKAKQNEDHAKKCTYLKTNPLPNDEFKKEIERTKAVLNAVNTMRNFQAELGNNYSIIQTRQNFTEALSDVLETGADNLVLADMNETSAEYLMLQTRQQLAVNSLSLASQSASSILSLF